MRSKAQDSNVPDLSDSAMAVRADAVSNMKILARETNRRNSPMDRIKLLKIIDAFRP